MSHCLPLAAPTPLQHSWLYTGGAKNQTEDTADQFGAAAVDRDYAETLIAASVSNRGPAAAPGEPSLGPADGLRETRSRS